jgi:hypothetical protein
MLDNLKHRVCALAALSLLVACGGKPTDPPALNASHATDLLKYHGWAITEGPIGTRPETGCIVANKNGEEGRFCVKECEYQKIPELAVEFGSNYGYHLGGNVECELYMVFAGSAEMRRVLAGERHMEPSIPEESRKLMVGATAPEEAPVGE